MANVFAVKPELPQPFPNQPEMWQCPITGLYVPKDPAKNLAWRAEILAAAEDDEQLQQDLYTACSQSVLFWINAFAFTFRVFDQDEAGKRRQVDVGHIPYVTWDIQDKHILAIEDAINNGYDLLTDKTRDMGASWDHIVVFHHQFLFRPGRLFLEMSRVETDVDGADNPRCLFVKHDYINKWLPEWMVPKINRVSMHIHNLDNGSRIDGESSNKAAGSSARVHAILLDEFAKMENAEKIKSSTRDVTPCRLPNSTPWGPGTTYSKWRRSGQIKVFVLPWYEHPEKGRDRYITRDETTGKFKIRSPWYNEEEKRRSQKEMAQEIDMDHIGSGDTYFDAVSIEQNKLMFARPWVTTRTIDFAASVALADIAALIANKNRAALKISPTGHLKIWSHLIGGRFDQTMNYVMGIDISKGQGASNSVISIFCKETGEKVGEWADANTPPHDFARIACAIAMWVGGARDLPLIIWEANGDPGIAFGRELVKKFKYPHCYIDRTEGTTKDKEGIRYGWHSSPDKKASALGEYARALAHGGFINHSAEALDEALLYVYYEGGGIGPASLVEESAATRKAHGDRVIADILCLHAVEGVQKQRIKQPVAPHRSMAGRMQETKRLRKEIAAGKRFDFRHGGA